MIGQEPVFMRSEYLTTDKEGNYVLKLGAPKEVTDSFNEYKEEQQTADNGLLTHSLPDISDIPPKR